MFDFDIHPIKYDESMDWTAKMTICDIEYGGWFDKETLRIAIFGTHYNILDYADTINHECLHLIVQEFVGGHLGWKASSALDHKSMRNVSVLDGILALVNFK